MNTLGTLGIAMGSAWLSGINLYAAVLTMGLLQRFHLAQLPGDLNALSEWWVIAISGTLYLIEFIADKIPAVDSVWDAIHTFIRIPAGAILAAGAFAHFEPSVRIVAMLIGGSIALSSHGMKAATRVAVNTSPEPFSNIAVSLVEDVVAFGSAAVMAFHPVVILVVVVISVAISLWIIPRILRALRRLFQRRRTISASPAA
jgi:hypothetical protein